MKTNKSVLKNLKNGLYILATPIGNLNDISIRSIFVLKNVDFIICENPKHSLKLLNKLGIKKKLLALHDYNEDSVIKKISKYCNNSKIALISDAGSPLISDPGYKLVKYFIEQNYIVTTIPGPSSLICALQISGIPINNFLYFGFVPKQTSKRIKFFKEINSINLTSVFFVSAKNLEKSLENIIQIMGEREISICKEITKLNESVFRGTTNKIYRQIIKKKINLIGELTVVLARKVKQNKKIIGNETIKILAELLKKFSLTESVKIVHNLTGISKKDVYQKAIKLKHG